MNVLRPLSNPLGVSLIEPANSLVVVATINNTRSVDYCNISSCIAKTVYVNLLVRDLYRSPVSGDVAITTTLHDQMYGVNGNYHCNVYM